MILEAAEQVANLQDRLEDLDRSLDYKQALVWQIYNRYQEGQTYPVGSQLTSGRVAWRIDQEIRDTLMEKVQVATLIRNQRPGDKDPLVTRLQRFTDSVVINQLEHDILRFDTLHGYLPDHALLTQQAQFHRWSEEIEADPEIQEARRRLEERGRPPLQVIEIEQANTDFMVISPNSAFEQLAPKIIPGVRNIRENERKVMVADIGLPGGETITVEGKNVVKILGVLLTSSEHLTMKQIAQKGWETTETRVLAVISPTLKVIRQMLKPGTNHALDEIEVEVGATKPAKAFLVKDLLNRQLVLAAGPESEVTVSLVTIPAKPPATKARPRTLTPPVKPAAPRGGSPASLVATSELMPGIGPDGRPKLVPVSPGRLGLRAWAQNPGITPDVLFGIISAQGTIEKTQAIEGVVEQLAAIVAKQATGRLSPDEAAILRYARDYIPVSNDKLPETCRILVSGLLKDIEAYTPTNGTSQNGSIEFQELTEVLEAQVVQFVGKLRGKTRDGFVTMKVARTASGKYGPQRLGELRDESRVRTVDDGIGNELYNVDDLIRVHFGERVAPEILGQVLEIAEQELTKQS